MRRIVTFLLILLVLDLRSTKEVRNRAGCDCEAGSTHKSREEFMGAVLTKPIDDLLCHWVAFKERRDGRYTEAGVKVPRSHVLAYRIGGD